MTQNPRTPLTDVLQQMQPTENGFAGAVPPDWLQGRAIYGGLSAALCLAAAQKTWDDLPPLRSAQLTFIGPASSEVEVVPMLVRRGKSTAFITADLMSDGKLAVRASFCFGAQRDSRFSQVSLPAPDVPGVDACEPFFREGSGPNFAGHFNSRHAAGPMPMSGDDAADICIWLQHKDSAAADSIQGLVALADAPPPAGMTMFSGPAPLSTMTWMFDVLAETPRTEDGWWLSRSTAQSARDGYSSQEMVLWNTDGEPVMVGRQNVAIFA